MSAGNVSAGAACNQSGQQLGVIEAGVVGGAVLEPTSTVARNHRDDSVGRVHLPVVTVLDVNHLRGLSAEVEVSGRCIEGHARTLSGVTR